jgi:hypothetical protein
MRECGGAWCDDDDDASITTSTAEGITKGKNVERVEDCRNDRETCWIQAPTAYEPLSIDLFSEFALASSMPKPSHRVTSPV